MNEDISTALILMSTYNGEKFLAAQIDSIISQTFERWVLIIRDDGSTDGTVEIIKKYCQTDPRILFLKDDLGNLNILKSFSVLMQKASTREEDFIFFCDQDDVWLSNKLALQVSLLRNLENKYGPDNPILVHSDLRVVDNNLNEIHSSYLGFEKIKRNTVFPLKTLLINNFVTGCTLGMNRKLLKISTPIPDNAFMHDWWCALCAATAGKIGFIDEATLLYRQHRQNSIGSKGFYGKLLRELFSFKASFVKKRKNLKTCFDQAQSLLSRINNNNKNYPLLKEFANLVNKGFLMRYITAASLRLKPSGSVRGLAFWVFLVFA